VSAPGIGVANIDELASASVRGEVDWRPVRHHFGIEAFGANAWFGDSSVEVIEEHDEHEENTDGHEELYLVVSGSATFTVDGDRIDAPAGTLVAITDPGLKRKAVADEDGTVVLAVGAPKGAPYRVAAWERNRLG
jgi:quercetin dioxygenase-like cupin family protein